MHDLPHHRARHILQPTSECCTMLMLLSSSPPSTLHANNFTRLTTHRLRDICRNLKKGRKPILNMMKLAVLIALSALCSASAAERSLLQAGLPNFPLPASPPPPPSPPITPGTPPPPLPPLPMSRLFPRPTSVAASQSCGSASSSTLRGTTPPTRLGRPAPAASPTSPCPTATSSRSTSSASTSPPLAPT